MNQNHNRVRRSAEPAHNVYGRVLFDAIPKSVFARVAYELARKSGPDGADVGDQVAKKRLLEVWDGVAPEGLPLPSAPDRALLTQDRAAMMKHLGLSDDAR